MSASASQKGVRLAELTEATAERGAVIALGEVVISEAERWFEDGLHVIRSLEFDCLAEHEDPDQVVDVFVDNAWDLGAALHDLQARREATEHELETLALLSQRFFEAAQATEREQRKRRVLIQLRQRGHHASHWRRQTQPATSTTPSFA